MAYTLQGQASHPEDVRYHAGLQLDKRGESDAIIKGNPGIRIPLRFYLGESKNIDSFLFLFIIIPIVFQMCRFAATTPKYAKYLNTLNLFDTFNGAQAFDKSFQFCQVINHDFEVASEESVMRVDIDAA